MANFKETQKQIEMQNQMDEAKEQLMEAENEMKKKLDEMIQLAMEADDGNAIELYEQLLAQIDFQDQQIKAFRGMRIAMDVSALTAQSTKAMAEGLRIMGKFTGPSLNLPSDKQMAKEIAKIQESMANILGKQKRMIRNTGKISVATPSNRTQADMDRAKQMVEDRRIKQQMKNSNFADISAQIEKAKNTPVSN